MREVPDPRLRDASATRRNASRPRRGRNTGGFAVVNPTSALSLLLLSPSFSSPRNTVTATRGFLVDFLPLPLLISLLSGCRAQCAQKRRAASGPGIHASCVKLMISVGENSFLGARRRSPFMTKTRRPVGESQRAYDNVFGSVSPAPLSPNLGTGATLGGGVKAPPLFLRAEWSSVR